MVPEITALIAALGPWSWPTAAVLTVFILRAALARLIDRTAEFEVTKSGLKAKTRELRDAAAQIERPAQAEPEVMLEPPPTPKALPPAPIEGRADIKLEDATLKATVAVGPARDRAATEQHSHEVATEAGRSPKAALVLLSAEIERNLRELLAATGWHRMRKITSVPVGFEMLAEAVPVSSEVREAALRFWEVRNKLVHGRGVAEDDVLSAVDSGLKILKVIAAIPREVNVVDHPGADVFSDPKGQHPVTAAKALILATTGQTADGTTVTKRRVYPTTRTDYKKGQLVAWEWNMNRRYGESWYRDPDTGKIEYGWTGSMEFTGRPLDQVI